VVACVTLFFSITGAGFAASRYLISSVSQIKLSVRTELRGQRGVIEIGGEPPATDG
jgi:hypothetical protein